MHDCIWLYLMYVMHDCFIMKNKWYLPLRHTCAGEFNIREFGY